MPLLDLQQNCEICLKVICFSRSGKSVKRRNYSIFILYVEVKICPLLYLSETLIREVSKTLYEMGYHTVFSTMFPFKCSIDPMSPKIFK